MPSTNCQTVAKNVKLAKLKINKYITRPTIIPIEPQIPICDRFQHNVKNSLTILGRLLIQEVKYLQGYPLEVSYSNDYFLFV